jgi:Flp pilus assembly pilin Flp
MNNMVLRVYAAIHSLMQREEGQDLVEYSLTFAMVAFGCVASMNLMANSIESVFLQVVQILSTNIT